MKVLFLLSMNIGRPGPSLHLLKDIITECSERGHEIDVISKGDGEAPVNFINGLKNVRNHTVNVNENKNNWIKRYVAEVTYMCKCAKVFKKEQYDVVFLQSCNVPYFAIKLIRKHLSSRIVYNVQDIFPHNLQLSGNLPYSKILFPIFSFLQKKAYLNADKIITISRDMKELLFLETKGRTDIEVIHNWGYQDKVCEISDSENQFLQHCIKEHNLQSDVLNVVYAGNMGVVQNVDIILSAAKELKEESHCRFWFIGEGAKKESLIKKADFYKLSNVTFLPLQPEGLAPFIYSMADVNIIPLQKGVIRTALPSKTPACLASGRNLIACIEKDSELSDILSQTEGCYVVDNVCENELVNTIKSLIPVVRKIFINRSASLQEFSSQIGPQRYVDVLETW